MASKRISLLIRSFASSTASEPMVKPPIKVFGLEGRYATALFSAASKKNVLKNVEKDLDKFQDLLETDEKLIEFIKDPSIDRSLKAEALENIKLDFNKITTNLLGLLAENGRLKKVSQVIDYYKLMMAAHRGDVMCEVTTAKELDSDTKKKLLTVLKGLLKKGETIQLTENVDPSIMGGMIVSIGDKYVDMSVASKIKKFTNVLKLAI